jgi:F-type H+-transporting ATPase subunit b
MRCCKSVKIRTVLSVGLLVIGFLQCSLLASAAGEEAGWGWIETIGRWFNLLILFGVIFYFARKPVSQFLTSRREGIGKEIEEAHAAREEAENKLASMEARMRDLESELEEMRRQAQAEAELEKRRIVDQASEESEKIIAVAGREIEGLTRAARQNLRDYAVELSMEMASRKIAVEMDKETQNRVIDRFLVRLTGADGESK